MPAESDAPDDLATRLLDAQVEWIVADLSGDRLGDLLGGVVDDLFETGARLPLETVVTRDTAKAVLRRAVAADGTQLVESLVETLTRAIYGLPSAEQHELGALVAREHVDTLVTTILNMDRLHERAMDRMLQSPMVGEIASRFMTRVVSDFVQQNRERMEKVPGAKSLMSIGFSAAGKMQKAAADSWVGDAAGKGAQFAVRRTNAATKELLKDAPLREAALELWDLQAAETLAALREYMTVDEVLELAQVIRVIVTDARDHEVVADLLDSCVDAVFDAHGDTDVITLLGELGIGPDDVHFALDRAAPQLLDTLRETGDLDYLIRSRLAPFYESDEFRSALSPT